MTKSNKKTGFNLAESATHVDMFPRYLRERGRVRGQSSNAFTLAEVLIVIGVIGIVAALTIPSLMTNIIGRVRSERVDNIKKKLAQGTNNMMVLGQINGLNSTEEFVSELSKYMKISSVCSANELDKCWPTEKIVLSDGTEVKKSQIKDFLNPDLDDKWAAPVAIITGDGTPMIFQYNKECAIEDNGLTTDNGIKVDTTSCIAGIFDWNGNSAPNNFGLEKSDVLAFNGGGLGQSGFKLSNGKTVMSAMAVVPDSDACVERYTNAHGIPSWVNQLRAECDAYCGANKQCENLGASSPTSNEMLEIINYLYGTNVESDFPMGPGAFDLLSATAIESNVTSLGLPISGIINIPFGGSSSDKVIRFDNNSSTVTYSSYGVYTPDTVLCVK